MVDEDETRLLINGEEGRHTVNERESRCMANKEKRGHLANKREGRHIVDKERVGPQWTRKTMNQQYLMVIVKGL
jgi:hypothetical protein